MGTRSTIALEFADGSVSQVYCHWDGYLDHNGAILKEHYSDPFKLRDLIDMGDMSSLGTSIGVKHPFGPAYNETDPVKKAAVQTEYDTAKDAGYTTFYKRDRGEDGCEARNYKDTDEYFDCSQQEEYDYILRNVNGVATWFVRCYSTDGVWLTLEEAKVSQEECTE